jgi:hypothetical protein
MVTSPKSYTQKCGLQEPWPSDSSLLFDVIFNQWQSFLFLSLLTYPFFGTCFIRKKNATKPFHVGLHMYRSANSRTQNILWSTGTQFRAVLDVTFHRHGYDVTSTCREWTGREDVFLSHSSTINAWQEFEVAFINNVLQQHMRSTNIILLCQIQCIFWTPRPGLAQTAHCHSTGVGGLCKNSFIHVPLVYMSRKTSRSGSAMVTWDKPAMAYWISRLLCAKAK